LNICLRSKIFYGIPGTKEYIEGTKEGNNIYLKTKFGYIIFYYILEFVRKNMNEL